MSDLKLNRIILNIVLWFGLIGCAGQSTDRVANSDTRYQLSSAAQLNARQRADLYEAILAADMAEQQQDFITAMSYYLFAAELSREQQLIVKSIEMARKTQDPLALERAAKIWLAESPDNEHALSILMEAQLGMQDLDASRQTAIQLLAKINDDDEQFTLLKNRVLSKEPRIAFNLLRELNKQQPENVAVIVAQAQFFLNLANANKQSKKILSQALARSEDALALKPLYISAIRLKTLAMFQLRQDARVRSYLSDLFIENPQSKAISDMLGQLLYDLRDYNASILHYAHWLEKNPQDLEARNYLAASYYAKGQFDISLRHFQQLLEQDYQRDATAFYCGDSAQKLGNNSVALSCFEQVTAGRYLAMSKIQMAKLLAAEARFDDALSTLTAPYNLNPDDQGKLTNAEIDLLDRYFTRDRAKQRLDEALQRNPDNLALILKKIKLYQLLEQPEKLDQLLHQARNLIDSEPKLLRFNLATAALLKNNGYFKLAIDWLDQALESDPQNKELLYTRALYLEPLGLYQDMIEQFKLLIADYPDDLNIKNALGYTLADRKMDLNYAQALIDSAYQGLPDSAAVIDSKGWIAYRLGDLTAALEYLKRAFVMSPSAEGAAHLGEVLWMKDKRQDARAVWLKGLQLEQKNPVLLETLERLDIDLKPE